MCTNVREQDCLRHILPSPNGPTQWIDLLKRSIPVSHCISSILGGLAVVLRFLYLTKSLHPKHSFRHCKIEVHGFMEQSLSTNLITQNARQTSMRQTIGYSVYQFAPPNLQVRVRVRDRSRWGKVRGRRRCRYGQRNVWN